MSKNNFKIDIEGVNKSISLEEENNDCDIPSLLLINKKCIENCIGTTEDVGPTVEEEAKGVINSDLILALKMFLKTEQGRGAFQLFMGNGNSISLNNEKVYTSNCEGDFFNKHALHFIEVNDKDGAAMASTLVVLNQRCVQSKKDYYEWHAKYYVTTKFFYDKLERLKKSSEKMYIKVLIKVFMREYYSISQDEKWSNERLVTQICHTIAHEFFIHAYRRAIPAMKAWGFKDFEAYDEIVQRDTGYRGEYDHSAYLQKHVDTGLNLMRSFQKELKLIVGNKMFKSVLKHHDGKYPKSTANLDIPEKSKTNTDY